MRIEAVGRTDIGMKRQKNEDAFFVDNDHHIYIVADGMGGHAAGEQASRTAVETIIEFMRMARNDVDITWPGIMDESRPFIENTLRAAFALAHKKIVEATQANPEWLGMATTVVSAVIDPDINTAYIAHVGDSRAYLIRNHRIIQITQDHSWVNEQIKAGLITREEARNHRLRNVVTRALGGPQEPLVDITEEILRPDDILILCTDGLTGPVEDHEILQIVMDHQDDLENATRALIDRANALGGPDNITVILIACRPNDEVQRPNE